MELTLVGFNTSNGIKILKNISKVEKDQKIKFKITKIPTDEKDKYNIKIVPTLIVNKKIISSGNVISEKELKNIVRPLIYEV